MVELEDRYTITSNRESGFGRYDVLMEPKNCGNDAYILEFKVFDSNEFCAILNMFHKYFLMMVWLLFIISLMGLFSYR